MIGIIYIVILVVLILIGTVQVINARDKYEAETYLSLIVIIYFSTKILYFILFNLSLESYFDINIALIFWKVSIFIGIFSEGLWASIHSVELHKSSKIRFLGIIIYFFLEGIIISLLLFPHSFSVLQINNDYLYIFQETPLAIFIIIFNIALISFPSVSQILGYKNFNDRALANFYSIYILLLTLNIIMYSIFLFTQDIIFRNLYNITFLINSCFLLYVILKKPALFLVFTNKVYDFIIFHKSGILLYSYNFQIHKEVDESILKGSILIGINHILANFSGIETQLDHIKMSDKGIVFNYQKELGYAILLIAKHKNNILEKTVQNFIEQFSNQYRENLLNLNGLIDVSIFKETGNLIRESFSKYGIKY